MRSARSALLALAGAMLLTSCASEVREGNPTVRVVPSPAATPTLAALEGARVTTIAGFLRSPTEQITPQDGPAHDAKLGYPEGLAAGPDGSLWFTDFYSRVVRRLDATTGIVETVAGSGEQAVRDGSGDVAAFEGPAAIAVSVSGIAYVSDSVAHRIRAIDPAGNVTTLAGGGPSGLGQGELRDGKGTEARFNLPAGIAVAPDGSLVVADKDNHAVRRVTPEGLVSTIATGIEAPVAVAVDPSTGDIFVATHGSPRVVLIDLQGGVSDYATNLGQVSFLAYDPGTGTLFASQTSTHRIVQFNATLKAASTVAGDGTRGYADGPGPAARFSSPGGIVVLVDTIIVADSGNGLLRAISIN